MVRRIAGPTAGSLLIAALCLAAPAVQAQDGVATASEQRASHTDFSGVWESARIDLVLLPEVSGQLTPEAQQLADLAAQHARPQEDDPARFCVVKGMPWTMLIRARNYPVEVIQYPDRVFMVFELYDQFRNIRIDGPPVPDNYPPSPNGWSTAHWDGETLVIETTGMSELAPLGRFRRSEETRITERWVRRADVEFGEVIEITMQIDDPQAYSTPALARQVLKRSPAGVVPGGYNCPIAQWNDYVAARNEEMSGGQGE